MKKKILSVVGATGVASIIALAITFSSPKTQASEVAKLNIKILTGKSGGRCTGPKGASTKTCESTNTSPCSDLSGCSSAKVDRGNY